MKIPKIVGIVNITADSFSDGGKFLEPGAAIEHAKRLLAEGADVIELGAASSNPRATHVPPDVEIERLAPVLEGLRAANAPISIDTTKPEVQRFALSRKVPYLNDIKGFPDEAMYKELASSDAKLVVMHFISDLDKAIRVPKSPREVFESIYRFFDRRLEQLASAGIPSERIIIDPGMGFFLASNPEPSLAVLAHIAAFKKNFGFPAMISVSRKSFLRTFTPLKAVPLTSRVLSPDVDIGSRTLAAELYAAGAGVDYIRTHDVRALQQGLATLLAIDRVAAVERPPR